MLPRWMEAMCQQKWSRAVACLRAKFTQYIHVFSSFQKCRLSAYRDMSVEPHSTGEPVGNLRSRCPKSATRPRAWAGKRWHLCEGGSLVSVFHWVCLLCLHPVVKREVLLVGEYRGPQDNIQNQQNSFAIR